MEGCKINRIAKINLELLCRKRARTQSILAENAFQLRSSNLYASLIGENDMPLTCASMDSEIGVDIKKIIISPIWQSLTQSLSTR